MIDFNHSNINPIQRHTLASGWTPTKTSYNCMTKIMSDINDIKTSNIDFFHLRYFSPHLHRIWRVLGICSCGNWADLSCVWPLRLQSAEINQIWALYSPAKLSYIHANNSNKLSKKGGSWINQGVVKYMFDCIFMTFHEKSASGPSLFTARSAGC